MKSRPHVALRLIGGSVALLLAQLAFPRLEPANTAIETSETRALREEPAVISSSRTHVTP